MTDRRHTFPDLQIGQRKILKTKHKTPRVPVRDFWLHSCALGSVTRLHGFGIMGNPHPLEETFCSETDLELSYPKGVPGSLRYGNQFIKYSNATTVDGSSNLRALLSH